MKQLIWGILLLLVGTGLTSCQTSLESYALPRHYVKKDVRTALFPLQEKYKKGEPVYLEFVTQNLGARPIRVCRWNSPLEGEYGADFLRIKRKKAYAPYTRDNKRRRQSLIKPFVTLKPGESLSVVIDASEAYVLERKGTYQIRFEGDAYNHLPNSEPVEIKIK